MPTLLSWNFIHSTDGINWDNSTSPWDTLANACFGGLRWAEFTASGSPVRQFVAARANTTGLPADSGVLLSSDGILFTNVGPGTDQINSVFASFDTVEAGSSISGSDIGMYLDVYPGFGTGEAWSASDGTVWTDEGPAPYPFLSIVNGGGLWVGSAFTPGFNIKTSPDAVTWAGPFSTGNPTTGGILATGFVLGAQQYISLAGVSSPPDIRYSADGMTWTVSSATHAYQGAVWSPDLALWCAVGQGISATSPDGATWTETGVLPMNGAGVTWAPALGLFVATGNHRAPAAFSISTSPNGLTWTGRPTVWDAVSSQGFSIRWSDTLGICVAAGEWQRLVTVPPWVLREVFFGGNAPTVMVGGRS